ncbi:MAG: PDZ domain-containing protein [Actinobacteria bacterium]|nr:PDZ domain-containing protein [Actinomycetota bacterium]
MRRGTAVRIAGLLVGAVALAAVILYLIPSDDYLLLPDVAHPVASLVDVEGARPARGAGGIYFVDVFERRASELEKLFPWLHSQGTLIPAKLIVPPGASDATVQQADVREMQMSQRIAAAVALKRLGYRVGIHPDGVIVSVIDLGTHAAGALQPTDVIVSVNGKPTPTIASLHAIVSKVPIGGLVTLGVRRGAKTLAVRVRTTKDPLDPKRGIIGFSPDQSARISLPIHVSIDAGNVGGPSAGLAFALEVMKKLGSNVDHGYKVAATGEMELDGTVAPIGGVEQKTFGARKAGADVFLVPAGDNAQVARRYAGPLRIIAVKNFPQALHALATLPRKG